MCDSCNVIYFITCSNSREQYVGSAINLSRDLEFTNLILKLAKFVVGLQDILLINVAALIINMFTWKCRLLSRYLIIISKLVLKIYYGNEKNIGRHNYLLTCMEWIMLMIYII